MSSVMPTPQHLDPTAPRSVGPKDLVVGGAGQIGANDVVTLGLGVGFLAHPTAASEGFDPRIESSRPAASRPRNEATCE